MQTQLLDELDAKGVELDLTPAERRVLRSATRWLDVEWHADGSARVRPAGHVGSLILSDDQAIAVTTKVPVENVLALASLAYRSAKVPPGLLAGLYDRADPTDWMAVMLIAEVEALLAGGLRQGYVTVEDSIPFVRGRLRFGVGSASWSRPGVIPCEFSDFILDTAPNRVIRAALEALATQRLLPGLRARLHQLLRAFIGVAVVPPGVARREVALTRLDHHYEPALRLSRLVLDSTGLEQHPGTVTAPAFFFPMATVFQDAVANYLADRLPGVRAQVGRSFAPRSGTPAHPLAYFPDVEIGSPPALVLDTKYARPEVVNQYGGRSYRNSNAYQIVFYAHSLGCPGALVYPCDDRAVLADFDVAGTRFSIVTVDLGAPGLAGLAALTDHLAGRLAARSAADVA